MKKQKYGFMFLFLAVILIMLIAYILQKKLENNYIVTRGNVISLETTVQNPEVFVRFNFALGNSNHKGMSSILNSNKMNDFKFIDSILEDKSLPVVYQKGNPDNNKMLLSKKDCKKYKVQLSLQEDRLIRIIDSLVNNIKN